MLRLQAAADAVDEEILESMSTYLIMAGLAKDQRIGEMAAEVSQECNSLADAISGAVEPMLRAGLDLMLDEVRMRARELDTRLLGDKKYLEFGQRYVDLLAHEAAMHTMLKEHVERRPATPLLEGAPLRDFLEGELRFELTIRCRIMTATAEYGRGLLELAQQVHCSSPLARAK